MVHHHHLPSQPSTSTSHPHGHGHGHGQHQHQHQHHHHSASTASYSYSPSDFDLLKALTSGSAGKNTAKKALKQQQSSSLRRPALDPLILETAASSGPQWVQSTGHVVLTLHPHADMPPPHFFLFPLPASLAITSCTSSIPIRKIHPALSHGMHLTILHSLRMVYNEVLHMQVAT